MCPIAPARCYLINDRANATVEKLGRGVVTVVPVTSNTARVYPFQVLLPSVATGLSVDSKGQAEQVRSISADHLTQRIGTLRPEELGRLDAALRLHLDL